MAKTGARPNVLRRATPRDNIQARAATLEDDRDNLMKRVGILEAQLGGCPCDLPYGEAWKLADQSIGNQSYVELTSWDEWNIAPSQNAIAQGTNGLDIQETGMYALSAYVTWASMTGSHFAALEWGGGEPALDKLASPIQTVVAGLAESADDHISGLFVINEPASISLFVEHLQAPPASKTVQFAMMKVVKLTDATYVDPLP